MVEVNVEIEIDADSEDIFAFISNFENNPIWQKGMVKCEYTKHTEDVLGTQYQQLARFLGKDIITTFEVIEYIPNRLIKATSIVSSFPITFTRWVEPKGEKTLVKALIEGDASGFFRLFSPLLQFMTNRNIQKDYRRLNEYFENTKN